MPSRRSFVLGAAATLTVPYVAQKSAIAATPIVRRDVMEMADTDPFFSDYAKAVQKMHSLENDNRTWLAQAKIHADYCHHSELEFLHWHRHYIRFFEKICAELSGNPDFALPYWNWSKNSGRYPAPFFDRQELNVEYWKDPGQYNGKAWPRINTVARRGLDKTHGLLDDPVRGGAFTLATINGIKQLSNIDDFRKALEGQPHNTGHVVAGALKPSGVGHIGSGLSPLDPIFWLHHCMVDRVWAEWQKSGHATPDPNTDYSGQFFEADGTPAKATSTGAMDIANLNYIYDIFQVSPSTITATPANTLQLDKIKELLPPEPPQTIGSGVNTKSSRANLETAVDISVPTLPTHVQSMYALKSAGVSLGRERIVARLSDVVQPETNDLVVNVFVDCPYLSPTTPYSDPHYAGTFSFFGARAMQGMPGMQPTYVIDITDPVREAGFLADKIKLQFMPVPASAGGESNASFQVGKIDIVRV